MTSLPPHEEVRELAAWGPPRGVISVYLGFDPDDRGGAWRTELRNGLADLPDGEGLEHEGAVALRRTAARIEERFANHDRDLPRGEVGFVEVSARPGADRWWRSGVAPRGAPTVSFDERPLVAPMLALGERDASRGVALVSAERVLLLESEPGRLRGLRDWEIAVVSGDWRERKAQRPPDPARAQAVSASGRDQFEERLEHNRQRFLNQCGRLASAVAEQCEWPRLLLIGAPEQREEMRRGVTPPRLAVDAGNADLVSEPAENQLDHVEAAVARLDAGREWEVAEQALERARAGTRAAAGRREVRAALGEARVERLVIDAGAAVALEPLVRSALGSGAEAAAVHGEAAELLAPVEGVAALLRY